MSINSSTHDHGQVGVVGGDVGGDGGSYLGLLPRDVFEMMFFGLYDYKVLFSVFSDLNKLYRNNETYWLNMFKRYVRNFDGPKETSRYFGPTPCNITYEEVLDAFQKRDIEELASFGATDMINFLITKYRIPSSKCSLAMRKAAMDGYIEIVDLLIRNNQKIVKAGLEIPMDVRDFGLALKYAAESDYQDIVFLLIDVNNVSNIKYDRSHYINAALECARNGNNDLLIKLINIIIVQYLPYLFDIDDYRNMMFGAATWGKLGTIIVLLEHAKSHGIIIGKNDLIRVKDAAYRNVHQHVVTYIDSLS